MLNRKDIKQLTQLLRKIKNPENWLPQPVFESLIKIILFIGCELVITNNKNEILLTWREDKWWKGWHIPGGLLRYNESFEKRISETARKELGISVSKPRFLFPINYRNYPCGHGVSLVFLCAVDKAPKAGKFFLKMPKNIIKEHRVLWKKIQENI